MPRPLTDPERLAFCNLCGADPGEPCTGPSGKPYQFGAHRARKDAACTAALPQPSAFGFRTADVMRLRSQMTAGYARRIGQLSVYFDILLRLAEKTDGASQSDLFDRIERVLAEMERRKLTKVHA